MNRSPYAREAGGAPVAGGNCQMTTAFYSDLGSRNRFIRSV